MKWTGDRFEGDFAVIECGDICANVLKSASPPEVFEGAVLTVDIDFEESQKAKNEADNLLKDLFGN